MHACAHNRIWKRNTYILPDAYPLYSSLMGYGCNEFPIDKLRKRMVITLDKNMIDVRTRIPERAMQFINQLVARGYYSSVADFARQSILDKLIEDFELGISELEPDLIEAKEEDIRTENNTPRNQSRSRR